MIFLDSIASAFIRSFICAKYKMNRFAAGLAIFSGTRVPSSSGGKPPLERRAACDPKLFAVRHPIYPIPRNIIRLGMSIFNFISRSIPRGWAGVFPILNQ